MIRLRPTFLLLPLAGLTCLVAGRAGPATGLADAAERRDHAAVTRLLAQPDREPDASQPDGMTALLWAAYHDAAATARDLLAAGADPNRANRYGVTALSLACRNGNAELVIALLSAGADPARALPEGETPLLSAARTGQPRVVEALLARGVAVDAGLPNGQTPLMWAAAEGHTEVVRLLLAAGADLRAALASGFNAWLFAVRGGHVDTVQALLAAGADLHQATSPEKKPTNKQPAAGSSALTVAIENGHFELAAALVDLGADPNDRRTGFAPLHILSWVRKPDISETAGDPPPDGSGGYSSERLVRHLVARGAQVDLPVGEVKVGRGALASAGFTPLLLAADRADTSYMKLLVELGADPHARTGEGATALMLAAGLGNGAEADEAGTEQEALEAVAYLLSLGADPNLVTATGETAVHGAAYAQFPRVAELLAQHGARLEIWNQANKQGWTPYRIAEGHRPGNFKPSYETIAALKALMLAGGAEIPPPMDRAKPKGYQDR